MDPHERLWRQRRRPLRIPSPSTAAPRSFRARFRLAPVRALVLFSVLALAACTSGTSGDPLPEGEASPETVASRLGEAYASGLGSLESFEVFAMGSSVRYEATEDSARGRVFSLVRNPAAPPPTDPEAANLFVFYPPVGGYLAETLGDARLTGPVEREGVRSYVLETTDPTDVGFPVAEGTREHLARAYIDAETLEVRELFHRFKADTLDIPFVQRVLYDDYREVAEGIRVPFRVRQRQEGLLQLIPQKVRVFRGGQLGFKEQQAAMLQPSARRAAMRDIERERRLLSEGVKELEFTVDSLRVSPLAR